MFRYISSLESHWEELTAPQSNVPDPNSGFTTAISSSVFDCISLCLMTDGCCLISYITISSLCFRYRKTIGHHSQNSSSVWKLVKIDTCPWGWYRVESSCFLFVDANLSWQDSVTYCQSLGARLAEVDTPTKDSFIRSYAENNPGLEFFWIGGSDSVIEGMWVWISSGSPITNYTNWDKTQPDDLGPSGPSADCLYMGKLFGFRWDDAGCSDNGSPVCVKPFI